jgi:hypothetical protein
MDYYQNEWKLPFKYANNKFPGFIGLTRNQFNAVVNNDLDLALKLGISYDDFMSLRYKNYHK